MRASTSNTSKSKVKIRPEALSHSIVKVPSVGRSWTVRQRMRTRSNRPESYRWVKKPLRHSAGRGGNSWWPRDRPGSATPHRRSSPETVKFTRTPHTIASLAVHPLGRPVVELPPNRLGEATPQHKPYNSGELQHHMHRSFLTGTFRQAAPIREIRRGKGGRPQRLRLNRPLTP